MFGPVPRSHEHSLNKKFRRAALRSAISHRVREGAVTVVENLALDDYKTKKVAEILDRLSLSEVKVLIVIDEKDTVLERSARNLAHVKVLRVLGLNVFDVIGARKVLMTRAAVAGIEGRLGDANGRADAGVGEG